MDGGSLDVHHLMRGDTTPSRVESAAPHTDQAQAVTQLHGHTNFPEVTAETRETRTVLAIIDIRT